MLDAARREDDRGRVPVEEPRRAVERLRLPGCQSLTGKLGEGGGIPGGPEGVARDEGGFLVLAVPVARRAGEDVVDDLRSEAPDDANGVFQYFLARPEPECLLDALGITEVVGAGEVLARPVHAPRRVQLLRADHSELAPELIPDQVLPAVSAR